MTPKIPDNKLKHARYQEDLRRKYADMAIAISLLDDNEGPHPPKRDIAAEQAAVIQCFRGEPFSRVFTQPRSARPDEWRLKYSGIQSLPSESETISAVWAACGQLGIEVKQENWGSPANCSSYHLDATFLDGGFRSKTGPYWYESRGAWVTGPKAVLLIALTLGLRIRPGWRRNYGLEDATTDSLKYELDGKS